MDSGDFKKVSCPSSESIYGLDADETETLPDAEQNIFFKEKLDPLVREKLLYALASGLLVSLL